MHIIFKQLSSKRFTGIVLFSWLCSIVFSWWMVPPRVDDGIYLIPAISFLHNYSPSVFIGSSLEPIFFIFPTQPFLHGIFLKILGVFTIAPEIDTYRIFNYLMVLILFYLIYKLFLVVFDGVEYARVAGNGCLILLGVSQFSINYYINRPEIPGLVFFVLALICSVCFIKKLPQKEHDIMRAFFFYGMAAVLHPYIALISVVMAIYMVYLIFSRYERKYFKFVIFFFIPVACFAVWFYINYETAYDQMFNRVAHASGGVSGYFPSVINMLSVLSGDSNKSFLHNLYLGLHMGTFLIGLLFVLMSLFWRYGKEHRQNEIDLLFNILGSAILLLFVLMDSFAPYYLLVSFLSVVVVVFHLLRNRIFLHNPSRPKNFTSKSLKTGIFFISIFMPLSFPIFHSMKVFASDGNYYSHHDTRRYLDSFLNGDEDIFINTAQLLPLYADVIDSDFSSVLRTKKVKVHWYFPVASKPSPGFNRLIEESIFNDYFSMRAGVWGGLKKSFIFDKNKDIAWLTVKGGTHVIKIDEPHVVYEDRQNIWVLSDTENIVSFEN